jgi:predicted nucleic acid-binding Zn ribbon protein
MRRNQTRQLGDLIKDCLDDMNISRTLKEKRIVNQWGDLLGKAIASRTKQVYIKDRTLHVHLTSSVVRNELMMIQREIKEKINELAGEQLIDKIVIR